MNYLHWNEKTINDFSSKNIAEMYKSGYVFTRIGKGVMQQTRSVRIDLSKFEISSENRRILKKTDGIEMSSFELPIAADNYDWSIAKLAKDFYDAKFGINIMSAQKVKEMLIDPMKSNFNILLRYRNNSSTDKPGDSGYAICFLSDTLFHYSYPFYDLNSSPKDMGMGMMLRAIIQAKESGKKYIYLGSLQRPTDTYKFQFSGLEWFDGGLTDSNTWSADFEKVKKILTSATITS